MAFVLKDRVKETTATTGTGTVTLAGAVSGFQAFSAIGTGNTTLYTILSGSLWETGIGTYTLSGTTLTRDTVLDGSSGAGNKITLAGTSTVFCDLPAAMAMQINQPFGLPPTKAGTTFTQTPIGAGSPTVVDNALGILVTAGGSLGALAVSTTIPSTPYSLTMRLRAGPESSIVPFMGWSDGTKCMLGYAGKIAEASAGQHVVISESSLGVFVGTLATVTCGVIGSDLIQRIRDDGTNVIWSRSFDGVTFTNTYSVAKSASYLGSSGFTRMVFGPSGNGTVQCIGAFFGT